MAEKLKDRFYTPESITDTAKIFNSLYSDFDMQKFTALVLTRDFAKMEFKEKMFHTTKCLHACLPSNYSNAIQILKKTAPKIKTAEAICLPDYVEQYGMDYWDISLDAMAWFTKFSTSEFAIRPYILKKPTDAMAYMLELTQDEDPKVRRFASEGCRPRLPWAMAISIFKKDPSPILPILEALKEDSSEFVRKSVANNLNDISKDHPEVVLGIAKEWLGNSEHTDWIVKHGCRTLLKAGNTNAMSLFGFLNPLDMSVSGLLTKPEIISIGDDLQFDFVIRVHKEGDVRLEYKIHYVKATGKVSNKVFKISEKTMKPGEHKVSRKHSFANLSTRKHYPGHHKIEVIINGAPKAQVGFQLKP